MLHNNADARRCSNFELGLPVKKLYKKKKKRKITYVLSTDDIRVQSPKAEPTSY